MEILAIDLQFKSKPGGYVTWLITWIWFFGMVFERTFCELSQRMALAHWQLSLRVKSRFEYNFPSLPRPFATIYLITVRASHRLAHCFYIFCSSTDRNEAVRAERVRMRLPLRPGERYNCHVYCLVHCCTINTPKFKEVFSGLPHRSNEAFWKGMRGMYVEWSKNNNNFRTLKKYASKLFSKKNCHVRIPWHWSNGQNSLTFFQNSLTWRKFCFFPDFSLTRGNPDFSVSLIFIYKKFNNFPHTVYRVTACTKFTFCG